MFRCNSTYCHWPIICTGYEIWGKIDTLDHVLRWDWSACNKLASIDLCNLGTYFKYIIRISRSLYDIGDLYFPVYTQLHMNGIPSFTYKAHNIDIIFEETFYLGMVDSREALPLGAHFSHPIDVGTHVRYITYRNHTLSPFHDIWRFDDIPMLLATCYPELQAASSWSLPNLV